jgi:hypothetical protein
MSSSISSQRSQSQTIFSNAVRTSRHDALTAKQNPLMAPKISFEYITQGNRKNDEFV